MTVTEVAAKLATAGLGDADKAAKALTLAMNAYGYAASDAQHVSDVLFKGIQSGAYTIDTMGTSLGYVVGMASQCGVSLEELVAMFSTLEKAGMRAERAGSYLSEMFSYVIRQTDAQKEAIKELSQASGVDLVSSFSAAGLESKGMVGVLGDLMTALEKTGVSISDLADMSDDEYAATAQASAGTDSLAESLFKLFPSVSALKIILLLTKNGMADFTSSLNETANAAGATGTAFDEVSSSVSSKFEILKNKLVDLLVTFGDRLLPTLEKVMNYLGGLADKLAALSPETIDMIIKIAALAAAVGPALIVGGKSLQMLSGLIGMIGNLKSVSMAVAGPVGLILLLIGGLAKAGYDAEGGLSGAFGSLVDQLKPIGTALQDMFTLIWEAIKPVLDVAGEAAKKLLPMIVSVLSILAGTIGKIIEILMPLLEAILMPLLDLVQVLVENIGSMLQAVLPPLIGLLQVIVGIITGMLKTILPPIVAFIGPFVGMLAQLVSAILPMAVTLITSLFKGLQPLYENVAKLLADTLSQILPALLRLVEVLMPMLIEVADALFDILMPLLKLAIVPLNLAFTLMKPILKDIVDLVEKIVTAFTKLVDVILGPVMKAVGWVADKVGGAIGKIASWLPFSPAKEGPLSRPVNWGYVTEGLEPALAKGTDMFESFDPQIKVSPLTDSISNLRSVESLLATSKAAVDGLAGAFVGLGNVVVAVCETAKLSIADALKVDLGGVIDEISVVAGEIKESIGAAIDVGPLVGVISSMVTEIHDLLGSIDVGPIIDQLGQLTVHLSSLINAIDVNAIAEKIGVLVSGISVPVNVSLNVDGLRQMFVDLVTKVGDLMGTVDVRAIAEKIGVLVSGTEIPINVSLNVDRLISLMGGVVTRVNELISEIDFGVITRKIDELVSGINVPVSILLDVGQVHDQLMNVVLLIKDLIDAIDVGAIAGKISQLVSGISVPVNVAVNVDLVNQKLMQLVTQIKDLIGAVDVSAVVEKIGELVSDIKIPVGISLNVDQAYMQLIGFVDQITGLISAMGEKISGLIAGVVVPVSVTVDISAVVDKVQQLLAQIKELMSALDVNVVAEKIGKLVSGLKVSISVSLDADLLMAQISNLARQVNEAVAGSVNLGSFVEQMETVAMENRGAMALMPVQVTGGGEVAGGGESVSADGPPGHIAVIAVDEEGLKWLESKLDTYRMLENRRRGGK
jgi:TP901 family phage tail tape measure protein